MEASLNFPLSFFLAALGYLVVTAAESSVGHSHSHGVEDESLELLPRTSSSPGTPKPAASNPRSGLFFLAALAFHSFFEGLAIGVEPDVATGFPVLVAILAHKGFAAFALANALTKARLVVSRTSALVYMGLFSLVTPIGIAVGLGLTEGVDPGPWVGGVTAFCAGTFLYVGLVEMIHRDVPVPSSLALWHKWAVVALGFGGMCVLAVWT